MIGLITIWYGPCVSDLLCFGYRIVKSAEVVDVYGVVPNLRELSEIVSKILRCNDMN